MKKRYLFSFLALTSLINFIAVPLIATEIQNNLDSLQSSNSNGNSSQGIQSSLDQLNSGNRQDQLQQEAKFCVQNEDCDDQNPCTREACVMGLNGQGHCLLSGINQDCQNNSIQQINCDDGDTCTNDSVANDGSCTHSRILTPECSQGAFTCDEFPGLQCCHFQSDCNDNNPNTIDSCVNMESETGYCQFQQTNTPESQPATPPAPEPKPETPPAPPAPKTDTPIPAITPPTTGPDYIFGSGCAISSLAKTNASTWIFTILALPIFLLSTFKNKKETK